MLEWAWTILAYLSLGVVVFALYLIWRDGRGGKGVPPGEGPPDPPLPFVPDFIPDWMEAEDSHGENRRKQQELHPSSR